MISGLRPFARALSLLILCILDVRVVLSSTTRARIWVVRVVREALDPASYFLKAFINLEILQLALDHVAEDLATKDSIHPSIHSSEVMGSKGARDRCHPQFLFLVELVHVNKHVVDAV